MTKNKKKTNFSTSLFFFLQKTEAMTRSLPLTLDTSNAIVVHEPTLSTSTTPPAITTTIGKTVNLNLNSIDDEDEDEDEQSTLNQNKNNLKDRIIYVTQKHLGIREIYESRKEFILGSLTAILVFFVILLGFIVTKRKSRTSEGSDKEILVNNEINSSNECLDSILRV